MAILYADFTLGNEGNDGTIGSPLKYAVGMGSSSSGKTLSAGDSMLLKRVETWIETLTVPSSGSAGSPITFGAYGSGAKPIITGSSVRDFCIDSNGVDYITIDNISLQLSVSKAVSTLWGSTNWTFNACDFSNIGTYCIQFHNGSNNGTITNCTFTDWGLVDGNQYAIQAIAFGATETGPVDVTGCTFTITQGANTTETTAVMNDDGGWIRTFSNNIVNGNSYLKGSGICIWRPASIATTITIHNNKIYDTSSSGIMVQELEDNAGAPTVSVKYNLLKNTCLADTLDTEALRGRIYTSSCAVTFAYNVINGTYDGTNAHHGIQIKDGDGTKIYNNVIYGCDDGIYIGDEGANHSTGLDVRNNIASTNRAYGLELAADNTITTWGYNCWYNNTSGTLNGKAAGAGDVTTDPLFVNTAGGDFRLQDGSPCINAGAEVGLTEDYLGNPIR